MAKKKQTKLWNWLIPVIIVVIILAIVIPISLRSSNKKGTIKIGAILPLTGVAKYYGEMATQGISLAVDEINNNGGINGEKLEVIYEDSATKPSTGVSAFYKLVDTDNVDVVISALSSISVPLAKLAGEKKVPIIGIMTTARSFMNNNYTFRYQPMTDLEAAPILWVLDNNLKNITNIGILYLNDEFGKDVASYLENKLKDKGRNVYTQSFMVTDKDFRTQILKLEDNNVGAIYAVGYGTHLQNIVKNLRELGFKGKILLGNAATTPTIRNNLGNSLDGVYVATPVIYCISHNFSSMEKGFDELATEKKYKINHYNTMSYDTIYIIKDALEGKDISSRNDIKEALEEMKPFVGTLGKIIKKDNGHELAFKLYAGVVNNSKIECLNLEK